MALSQCSKNTSGRDLMSAYASLMVALDLGPDVSARVKVAADLADRFGARLIGSAGRQPVTAVVGEAGFATVTIIEQDQEFASEEFQKIEHLFRKATGSHNRISVR